MFGNLLPEGQALPYVNNLKAIQKAAKDEGTVLVASADNSVILPVPGIVREVAYQSGIDAHELLRMLSGLEGKAWTEHADEVSANIMQAMLRNAQLMQDTEIPVELVRQSVVDNLLKKLTAKDADITTLTAQLKIANEAVDAREMIIDMHIAEIETLTGHVAFYKAKRAEAQNALQAKNAENWELKDQIKSLNQTVAAKEFQITKLQSQLAQSQNSVSLLEDEVAKLNNQLTAAQGWNTVYVNRLADRDATIASLQTQIATHNNTIVELNSNNASMLSQIDTLTQSVEFYKAKRAEAQAALQETTANLFTANQTISSQAQEINALQLEIADLTKTINQKNAQIAFQAGQIETLSAQLETATYWANTYQDRLGDYHSAAHAFNAGYHEGLVAANDSLPYTSINDGIAFAFSDTILDDGAVQPTITTVTDRGSLEAAVVDIYYVGFAAGQLAAATEHTVTIGGQNFTVNSNDHTWNRRKQWRSPH